MRKTVIVVLSVTILAAILLLYFYTDIFIDTKQPEISNTTSTETPVTNINGAELNGEITAPVFDVETSEPKYFGDVAGFYASPVETGEYPGIVMIHEWWGLNDTIKDMAKMLSSQGYRVLAVDLYNGEIAADSTRARELATSLDQELALENMQAAIVYLKNQGSTKLASLGWCFGGGQSMQLAVEDEVLDATVIYYGTLVTDQEQLSTVTWPVLGIFGAEDTSIPVETVNEFDAALGTLNIVHEVYIYPGVGHAFANPSGQNYAPDETKDAWGKTLAFLEKYLN